MNKNDRNYVPKTRKTSSFDELQSRLRAIGETVEIMKRDERKGFHHSAKRWEEIRDLQGALIDQIADS